VHRRHPNLRHRQEAAFRKIDVRGTRIANRRLRISGHHAAQKFAPYVRRGAGVFSHHTARGIACPEVAKRPETAVMALWHFRGFRQRFPALVEIPVTVRSRISMIEGDAAAGGVFSQRPARTRTTGVANAWASWRACWH
jgi:hypothetical protein